MNEKVCSGCGACIAACPVKCISLLEDDEGFLHVSDKGAGCIKCGLCDRVCPFLNPLPQQAVLESGYFYSDDDVLRRGSSSGGACGILSEAALDDGMSVVGAAYNASTNRVSHEIARSRDQLRAFRGSKYLQSDPSAIYQAIDGGPCLVTGTPCQIAGARLYCKARHISDRNAYIDFYCHGVPSRWLWVKYLESNGLDDIEHVSFRNKSAYGWNDWTLDVQCIDGEHVSAYLHDRDFFYSSFLSNLCLNRPCYSDCPFRGVRSPADLRVGDAWGHDIAGDNLGVSLVLAFSARGEGLVARLKEKGVFQSEEAAVAASAQVTGSLARPRSREAFIAAIRDPTLTQEQLMRRFVRPELARKLWRARLHHLLRIVRGVIHRKEEAQS